MWIEVQASNRHTVCIIKYLSNACSLLGALIYEQHPQSVHSVYGYLASSYIAHVHMFYSRRYVQQICKWTVPLELYYLVVLCVKFVVDLSIISEVFLNLVFSISNDSTCFIRVWYSLCAWTLNPDSTKEYPQFQA